MVGRWITAFFTEFGWPKLGLAPVVDVWDTATNVQVIIAQPMLQVGGGHYKYWFAAYDDTKAYQIRCDGGVALPVGERYKEGANVVDDQINDKATTADVNAVPGAVWDEAVGGHNIANTFGQRVEDGYQWQFGEWQVIGNQIIFRDNLGNEIGRCDLFDQAGNPTMVNVFRRVPI